MMDVSRNGGDVIFRTAFSDEYDLLQVLHGLSSTEGRNCPVDFRLAGLQRKGHPDIWHVDQVLAFSTDECSPMILGGEDIGGNHGHPCALQVTASGHGLAVRDVGTRWTDAQGLGFTLLRVDSADTLTLLSDNIGPSDTAYAFADRAEGPLTCLDDGRVLVPQSQRGERQLTPAIRHLQRDRFCFKGGEWLPGDAEGCDCAEIREVYEIVNPATVARAIRDGRPEGGYTQQPSLAAGEAMFLHRMTYRIESDGTILCDFDHELLQDVHMPCYLGIMYQEKCDLWGGGLWRYIPKVKAFEDKGRPMDFSRPYRTAADTMPNYRAVTKDLWTDPLSPPDRQIDFIRRADGSDGVAFAGGFLPVYDGVPQTRAANITDAVMLVKSCKTYPTFAGGASEIRRPHWEGREEAMHFPRLRGVAYKKYFLPRADGASLYTVPYHGDTYVYMDFFADEPRRMSFPKENARAAVLESTVDCRDTGDCLTASGAAGYAVFRLDGPQQKG